TFNIIVSNVNDQPYFDPVLEDKVIDEDLNFTYDINASDIDEGDSLTFESNITALGGSINDSGVLKWTPDNSHVGDNIIEVIVCDDSGAEDNCTSSSFTIEVENVNDAPVISPAIASLSFLEGRSVSVNLNDYVDDIDNTDEDITWAASGMSGLNVSIDPAEKMMEVSAPETWHGTERFNLTADDGALIEHNDTEEITVDVQSILSFSDLVVTIDGNDYSAGNNDLVGPASPDSSLSISLKLKNNYPEANEWVEEIVISARLDSSIDDETETSLPVSLDGSKSISRQLTFQNLPLDIVEGEYELTIRASGNDYDGVSREVEWVVYIDYLTENNEVRILDVSLEEDELSCYRESAINVSLVNTGETKQHVNLTVSNDDLGIYESEIIPIVARDTIIKEYGIELFDPVDAGDYPIDVKIGYYDGEGGYLTFEEQAILDVKKCFDVEGQNIDEDSPEDITIDLGDYVDDSLKDDSEFIYSIENETNTDLIGCEIAVGGQDLICSAPTADKNGYSDINISVVSESGLYTNYDVFRLTVNPVNDAPEAYGIEEEVDEDGSVMIDLNCTDIDDSSLAYEIISQPGHGTLSKNGSSVLYKPEADFHGMDPFTYSCNDGDLKSNEANVEITVHSVPDEPSIVDASPEDASPEDRILIGDGVPQEFSITIDDPDSISPSISWYVGGEIQAEIGTEFTYESDENFTVKVNISHSATDHEHTWNVEVSDVPVTSYKGTIHDVNESNIDSFEGLTAYNSYGMIDFGDRAIDLSNAVDVDRYFNITNGAVGIDSDADGFDVFQVPATITMYNLPYESVPSIYYNDGFEISGTEECTGSTDPSCTNIKYNSTTGTLEFYVSHFSMFFLNIVPPTADAGADQDVAVGQKVVLDGSASYDADGTIVSYSWTQIEGSSVAVNESSSASVGFTPSSAGKYVFRLTVTDDDSLKGTDEIEVNAEELPPMPPASETGNLTISDLDVKIGGDKDKDLQDNDKISEEAGPGDRIEFDIELENLFSSSSDIEIEDIEITVTIKDIDDGDDLEEEAEIESLDADDTDSVSLEFDVPYIVDEGEYDVIIEAEGDDDTDDENSHEIRWELVLEVKKDKHDLIIKDLSLSPSLVRCNRDTVLEIEAVNIGREDEDDVSIEITNEDLGIEIIEEEIELEEGDTDDSVFEKSYRFRISDDVRPGVYPIQVEVNYGSNTGDHKELELTVQKCEDIVTPVKSEPVEVVPIIPTQAKPKEAAKEAAPEVSFMDTSNYVTLLAILFVLLLGGVIFLIGAAVILSKKR
ncbi:cadherin-like domain-containing protein, partial [Candidatus Woesearchaeota archaeon]|nr:cadherin-like domain-containing protein [Candidatus Woesearchaeota archaeon]